MKAEQFLNALAGVNTARRQLARFVLTNDVWVCPTTARVAEPWGTYNLGRRDVEVIVNRGVTSPRVDIRMR
jgi:hypothetical protein